MNRMRGFLRPLFAIMVAVLFAPSAFGSIVATEAGNNDKKLRWEQSGIRVSISRSLVTDNSSIKFGSDVKGAILRSFAHWEDIAGFNFELVETDAENASPGGVSGDEVSLITISPSVQNLLIFGRDLLNLPAATRIFYDKKGNITEADIVLNPVQQFSTDGTFGTFDLEAVLTHEIGHLLGLRHIPVAGAVMSEHVARNGLYGVTGYASRNPSVVDISQFRALYGFAYGIDGIAECCAALTGKLPVKTKKNAPFSAIIWAEDIGTGLLTAVADADNAGNFELGGLPDGSYRLFWRELNNSHSRREGEFARAEISGGQIISYSEQNAASNETFGVDFIGQNGQLSHVSVPVNAGRSFTLFVGGEIPVKIVEVGSTTPYISIAPDSVREQDFGTDSSVISFSLDVDFGAPAGSYTLFARLSDGTVAYLPGAVMVTNYPNPWVHTEISQ